MTLLERVLQFIKDMDAEINPLTGEETDLHREVREAMEKENENLYS